MKVTQLTSIHNKEPVTWARMPHLAPSAQQHCGLDPLRSPCFPCPCFSAGLCTERMFGKCDLDYELVQEVVTVYFKVLSKHLCGGTENHSLDYESVRIV
jgi:hypothetical protein